MEKLALYFTVDNISTPNASVLQQNVILNIIYYLCRRGHQNLYDMNKDWFQVITKADGTKYVMQIQDEMDKNHREDDHSLTNQGKMYEAKCKLIVCNI